MNGFRTEISEFKGNSIITIFKDTKRLMSFGLTKARAIIACFDEIKAFIKEKTE